MFKGKEFINHVGKITWSQFHPTPHNLENYK